MSRYVPLPSSMIDLVTASSSVTELSSRVSIASTIVYGRMVSLIVFMVMIPTDDFFSCVRRVVVSSTLMRPCHGATQQCYVMSCHVMSCHVMSCHVMSCHVMSCHVMSCHVMSCHVMSCHVMSCHVMSCHVMSCHVMSCHVMSCHVMSCHVMSCHVMSCHVMSCYLSSFDLLCIVKSYNKFDFNSFEKYDFVTFPF